MSRASASLLKGGALSLQSPRWNHLYLVYEYWFGSRALRSILSAIVCYFDAVCMYFYWLVYPCFFFIFYYRFKMLSKEQHTTVILRSIQFSKFFIPRSLHLVILKQTSSLMHSKKSWKLMGQCPYTYVTLASRNWILYDVYSKRIRNLCTVCFSFSYAQLTRGCWKCAVWGGIRRQILDVLLS